MMVDLKAVVAALRHLTEWQTWCEIVVDLVRVMVVNGSLQLWRWRMQNRGVKHLMGIHALQR